MMLQDKFGGEAGRPFPPGTTGAHPAGRGLRPLACWLAGLLCVVAGPAFAAPADEVFVVYNLRSAPDSRLVAEHYAKRRGIPENRVLGLALPTTENITRAEFNASLRDPLLAALEERGLLVFDSTLIPAAEGKPGGVAWTPRPTPLRYLVLTYGVPTRITRDATLVEPLQERLPQQLRRNEASVDSELALLPLARAGLPLTGVTRNPVFEAEDGAAINVSKGILMVARLDGPSLNVARDLVDRALSAETNGFWGRAYFDARGLKDGNYAVGDEWILAAAGTARQLGFETRLDTNATTFPATLPLPRIAVYAGWYDQAVSGPFTLPEVDFMPGAVAYHLFSYSARTVHNQSSWVGALLGKGAAVTLGCVDEPYLEGTPNLAVFFDRLLARGFTFGEAAYAAQSGLSWQTIVVGDPLYRPRGRSEDEWSADLTSRRSPLLEWPLLHAANRRLLVPGAEADTSAHLAGLPETRRSPVLRQKLGDLYLATGQSDRAVEQYLEALKLNPGKAQRVELQFAAARLLARLNRPGEALGLWEQFFQENPKYPDLLGFYQEALPVAVAANRSGTARKYEIEIRRLTPKTTNAPAGDPAAAPPGK
jgi:uncharacterized protein (TIGR03790 family)